MRTTLICRAASEAAPRGFGLSGTEVRARRWYTEGWLFLACNRVRPGQLSLGSRDLSASPGRGCACAGCVVNVRK